MNDLGERILRLERAVAKWKILATTTIMAFVAVLLIGASEFSSFDKIQAHTIYLLGADEKPVLILSGGQTGADIFLSSPDQKHGMTLSCTNEGSAITFRSGDTACAKIGEDPKVGGFLTGTNDAGEQFLWHGSSLLLKAPGGELDMGTLDKGSFVTLKEAGHSHTIVSGE